jgi:uncharacterized repeat protein (TIGR01451 family)
MKILRLLTLFFLLLKGSIVFAQSPFEVVDDLAKVRSIALKWPLTENDLNSLSIRDKYTSDHNAVEHLYVQQELDGIPIDKAISGFHFKSYGTLVYATNGFLSQLKDRIVLGSQFNKPGINAAEAVRFAAIASGISADGVNLKSQGNSKEGKFLFSEKSWSKSEISVFLVFVQELNGKLKLAWEVPLDHPNSPDYWVYKIDAQTGKVLLKENYTLFCNHEEHSKKLPQSNNRENTSDYHSFSLLNKGSYRVFPYYLSSPLEGQRLLLNDPSDMISSPFGWHDTNGIPGAEYTITRGNNVHAYLDRDADNSPDEKTIEGGSGLVFDFPFDISKTPDNYQDAAVTQLFYMNNFMHDFTYRYGFNEEAGNFQQNLYGKSGKGGDPVKAEGQDASGFNNANFSTPPDGASGRMQMYLWMPGEGKVFTVNMPANLATTYNVGLATFGPIISSNPITGILIVAQDSVSSALACGTLTNAAAIRGKILVVDRGTCKFKEKVIKAEEAGALAVLVVNTSNDIITMGSDGTAPLPKIPVVMLPSSSGNAIKNALKSGQTVRATLQANANDIVIRDANFDNGIVAHEYGHGISNRLTGGPSFTSCLNNDEQMGEGWSDFFTLVTATKPGDNGKKGIPIGDYSDNNSKGIRRQTYSTDFSINNQTYDDVIGTTAPHPLGEVWASTLWDLYWKMADKYGFDPDIVNGKGGNNKAIQLVMDGMKLQNCNPGFLDGRDAIFAADIINNKGENECLLWEVFARRGLGHNAKQGSSTNRNDNTQSFDLLPSCLKTLKIEKEISPKLIQPGDTLTVKITLVNHQLKAANNLKFKDFIPQGCTYITGSLQGGRSVILQGDVLTFSTSDLNINESLVLFYKMTTNNVKFSKRLFLDELEGGEGNWLTEATSGSKDLWTLKTDNAVSGQFSWAISNGRDATDAKLRLKNQPIIQGTLNPTLTFYHLYEIDPGKDGGFLEYSLNEGTTWLPMPDSLFVRKGYDGRLNPRTVGFITRAFWGESNQFESTVVNLSPFKNEKLNLRWRFVQSLEGTEEPQVYDGWKLDDIQFMDANWIDATVCATASDGVTACGTAILGGALVQTGIQTSLATVEQSSFDVSAHPNPGVDEIFLNVKGEKPGVVYCTVSQISGQIMQETKWDYPGNTQQITLSTGNLLPGVYLIELRSENVKKVIRWVKL